MKLKESKRKINIENDLDSVSFSLLFCSEGFVESVVFEHCGVCVCERVWKLNGESIKWETFDSYLFDPSKFIESGRT